jgi:hypothetical protein
LLECRRELAEAKRRISELNETIAELRNKEKEQEVEEEEEATTTNRFLPPQQRTVDITTRLETLRNSKEKLEARESPPSLSRIRPWHSGRKSSSEEEEKRKIESSPVTSTTTSPPLSRIRPWRSHRHHHMKPNAPSRAEKEKWLGHQNTPVLGDTLWRRLSWWPTNHHAAHNTAFQRIVLGRRKSYGGTPL